MLNPIEHAKILGELLSAIAQHIHIYYTGVAVLQTLPKINYIPQSKVQVLFPDSTREAIKDTIRKCLLAESEVYGAQQQIEVLRNFYELIKESSSKLKKADIIFLTKFIEDFPAKHTFSVEVVHYDEITYEEVYSELFQRLNKKLYDVKAEEINTLQVKWRESEIRSVEKAKADVHASYREISKLDKLLDKEDKEDKE